MNAPWAQAARSEAQPAERPTVAPSPRRLLHVFPSFDVGGAQVRFLALVEAMGPRYHHMVLSLNGCYDAARLLQPGWPVELCGPPPQGGNSIARIGAYHRALRGRRPDLLLTYNWGAMEMAAANALAGTPHIHMEDGFGPEEVSRQVRRRVWARRLLLSRAQLVVPSLTLEAIARGTWALDRRRVHHIPNGILPRLHASPPGGAVLDLPAGRPRVVWAGALRPEKNPLRMLRAFAPLRDAATLVVIGVGPEQDAVLREAERLQLGDSLHLLGARADVRDIIMQCDIALLSSDTEQMPIVVLEAMDAGLPVAACDVGDVLQMVAPENRPFVGPPEDAVLTRSLQILIADAALRVRVGKANRRRLRARYTLTPMVEAYGALIERTAGGQTGCGAP